MAIDKKIKRAIETIDAFIDESIKDTFNFGKLRNGIQLAFYSNNELDEVFKEAIPPNKLGDIGSFLWEFTRTSGYGQLELDNMKSRLIEIKEILNETTIKNRNKIFYSWQSDLSNNANRNFIEESLKQAIKEINRENNIYLDLDKDTLGEAGSPDIVNTILKKIDNSIAFICDVSFVTRNSKKGIPNPNVMFELGYAKKSLGDSNIVMIFNENSGVLNEMPFDLGLKRMLTYNCNEQDEIKADKRRELAKKLKQSVEAILINSGYIEK